MKRNKNKQTPNWIPHSSSAQNLTLYPFTCHFTASNLAWNHPYVCIYFIRIFSTALVRYYSVNHSKSIAGLDLMKGNNSALGQETIVTVSHDATVRLWEIAMSKGICCKSSKTIYTEFDCVEPSVEDSLALNDGLSAEVEEKLLTAIKVTFKQLMPLFRTAASSFKT